MGDGVWPDLHIGRIDRVGAVYRFRRQRGNSSYNQVYYVRCRRDADFVLLDSDVLTIPKEDIYKTQVTATYICGEKVWA